MTLQPPQPSRHRTTDSEERNYQQIRVRQDTNTNWLKNNPVPASGEWCYSIGHRNPPTTYPLDSLPPATKELEGTYILVSNEGETYVYECIAGLGGNGYVWRPRSVEYVEPQYADQCVKIGDGNVRWSELPWLGGRGPQGGVGPEGPQGEKAWGVIYRTVETVSAEGQTIFRLMTTVEPETSMVTINGVVLSPSNYTLTSDLLTLTNSIATKAGDIVSVFSWIGAVESIIAGLNTADIETLSVRPTGIEAKPRSEIKNQQEVNWYLLDKIDDLEIPDEFDPDGLATEEWVLDQSYITEQVVTDAVSNQAADQALIDQEQDREIESIETRVSQIESVSLDARYMFEGDSQIPRDGEFTILKEGASEIAEQWADASVLYFAENALDGSPDWDGVTENDVIRIGGSSVGNIIPTDIQSREADTFAEFRIEAVAGERLFNVSLVRSASQPLAGIEYGVVLLSSFDPSGLATQDYVVEELAKKFDKSGGTIKGAVSVEDGNLTVKDQEFRVKTADDNNAFRVQPDSAITFNIPARMNDVLDMRDNKIVGCGPADPKQGNDVVNVDFLNEALGTIDVNVGDAELAGNNTFTGTNTFQGLTHFESAMISKAGTFLELKGDDDSVQNRYMKLRGNADFRIYAYPGDNNNNAKNCFSILMKPDDSSPTISMNYLADPSSAGHPVNLRYANATYLKIEDYTEPTEKTLAPITFKMDQYATGTSSANPSEGEVCGMYNTSPGSSTSANPYWGNVNVELRVHKNKLKNPDGNEFASGERYSVMGFVTLIGKDNKTYLKSEISSVVRPSGQNYVSINFSNRTKVFGTGSYSDSSNGYAVLIEGYTYG